MRLTSKQDEANLVLAGPSTHIMLFGGARSGKTFLLVRAIVMRAFKAPKSRHAILRFRFHHVKASIVHDTFPRVMEVCFPGQQYHLDKSDWFASFTNGSQIWFSGLDDKERTEKILGQEYVTIYLNECSQIPWASRNMALTRLAQQVEQNVKGMPVELLRPRMYYDCNPPNNAHWSYRLFVQKVDPETRAPLVDAANYARLQMNPKDNAENISSEYLAILAGLSARMRRRFEYGEFSDATANALFDEAVIDKWRVMDGVLPQLIRVVVGVDPSGSGDEDNADNDEIGVVVGALGADGNAYLIEDNTVKAGPATWGGVAVQSYARHKGDALVAEVNYGGAMVKQTIQAAAIKEGVRVNFKQVTASRGKTVRAEPFSALYEQGKIRHVGILAKVEDELCAMTTSGYSGNSSPNRADAWIWVLAELFPAIVAGPKVEKKERERVERGSTAWMG